jgi:hypothetical protein
MKEAAPGTIDLAWAGTDADGTQVYAPPRQAAAMHLGRGIGWLLTEHPRETLSGVALASVAGTCVYLVRDAIKHDSPRKHPRRPGVRRAR